MFLLAMFSHLLLVGVHKILFHHESLDYMASYLYYGVTIDPWSLKYLDCCRENIIKDGLPGWASLPSSSFREKLYVCL